MLCLTHNEGDKTFIDVPPSDVTRRIAVVIVKGSCKLGFDAPRDINVVREKATQQRPIVPRERSTELVATVNAVAADLTGKIEASAGRKE